MKAFLLTVPCIRIIFIKWELLIFCFIKIIIELNSLFLSCSFTNKKVLLIYFFIILIDEISLMINSAALFKSSNIFDIVFIIIEIYFIILILVWNIKSSIKLPRQGLILLFLLHLFKVILFLTTKHKILIYFCRHIIFISYSLKKFFVL